MIHRQAMDIDEIKARIRENRYVYSVHADYERKADNLTIAHVEQALLSGTLLEDYPDTGRGESCLVVGHFENVPVHVFVDGAATESS